jgi:hypothetical protein
MEMMAQDTAIIIVKGATSALARQRRKVMNNLIKEALEIAIENWEFDGEYDKANQAFELMKGEASE